MKPESPMPEWKRCTAMKLSLLVPLACCFFVSCGPNNNTPKQAKSKSKDSGIVWVTLRGANIPVSNKAAEEWAIRHAVFLRQTQYQTQHSDKKRCFIEAFSTHQDPPKYSNGSQIPDPPSPPVVTDLPIPDWIMDDFRRTGRRLGRVSECEITKEEVIDRATGEAGLTLFSVGNILWLSPTEAEVTGDAWTGPEGASGTTYFLRKINGAWTVTGEKMEWIS